MTQLATGTPGTATNVGSGLSNNQYEVTRAIDPANPLKQAVCGKLNKAETQSYVIWTTDGWATQTSQTFSTVGDPVIDYAVNGDLVLIQLYKTGDKNLSCWRNVGGAQSAFGSRILMGLERDRPAIAVDRTGGSFFGRIYVVAARGNSATAGMHVFFSDDHGVTWSRTLAVPSGGSASAPDGQYSNTTGITVTPSGAVVISANGPFSNNNTNYQWFTARSLDGAATWSTGVAVGIVGAIGTNGYGAFATGQVCADSDYLYMVQTNPVATYPAGFPLVLVRSADLGATWEAKRTIYTPPNQRGCAGSGTVATDHFIATLFYVIEGQFLADVAFRVYATWSFDKGVTWTTPVEVSTQRSLWNSTDQVRDAGGDHATITAAGPTAYLAWSEGSTAALYQTRICDIAFTEPPAMALSSAFSATGKVMIQGGAFLPDGNTGADLQDAIDAAVANGGGTVDCRHLRGIDVRQTITLDPTQVTLIGDGTVFDTTLGGTLGGSNVGLLVQPGASARPRGQGTHFIEGFRFDGTGAGGSQKAVLFEGNGTNPDARGNMRNCFIEDYNIGIWIKNNAYVNKFNVVDIRGCAYAARSESGGTNRGECISFVNCTLGNGNTIWAAGHSIDWMFTGCSFDFPSGAFIYTDDKVYCVNCHFEDSASTNKNWFQVDNNGHIYLTQCNIGFATGTYSGNTLFKQWGQGGKFRLLSCNGNVPASGVTVTNAGTDFYSDTGVSNPFWP